MSENTFSYQLQDAKGELSVGLSLDLSEGGHETGNLRVKARVRTEETEMVLPVSQVVQAAKVFLAQVEQRDAYYVSAAELREKIAVITCRERAVGGCLNLECVCHKVRNQPIPKYDPHAWLSRAVKEMERQQAAMGTKS